MTRAAFVTAFILTALPQLSTAQTTNSTICDSYYSAESTYAMSSPAQGSLAPMASTMMGAIHRRPVGAHDMSAVLEVDNGYPQMSVAAGVQRSRTLGDNVSQGARAKLFGQVLVGALAVWPGRGNGGLLVQPGVGMSYGDKMALHVQVDYRLSPGSEINGHSANTVRFSAGFTRRFRSRTIVTRNGTCAAAETMRQQPPPPVVSTPPIELGFAFNGPQYWTAEFPGIALSAALNRSLGSHVGAALIGEYDAAYARPSLTGGARIYTASAGRWRAKLFAQALVGATTGQREGIIQGYGGATTLVGAGVMLGTARRSFFIQVDHRHISGGHIVDEMRHTDDPIPSKRVAFGINYGVGGK